VSSAAKRLAVPTLAMLPRVADSLSFLYADVVRIVQDDTGVCAMVDSPRGTERVYLPVAALACVLLGPGTSITQPALATCARHGTTVVCVGSGAVRCYAGLAAESLTTAWLERQVRAWADAQTRRDVAADMYAIRFGKPVPDGASLARLRGMEGQRVKAMYRLLARQHRISRFRRAYDPREWDHQDPVNLALSAANACLYGVVHAAVLALGCSAALGFIHHGGQYAFVYDIADLYKSEVTIPLAFSLHNAHDPERQARLALRDEFRLLRLLPRIVTDIQGLLDPHASWDRETTSRDSTLVSLWDPDIGLLPGGVNYGGEEQW
jgi:CRISPR-associated protein Cas1